MNTLSKDDFRSHFEIDIAEDFSNTPKGKMRKDGPYSAEVFREDILIPALNQYEQVTVILDGVKVYPNGFLKEAFSKLNKKFSYEELTSKLYVETNNINWATEVWGVIDENSDEF